MNNKNINIAFNINEEYIPYCAVTIASILKNTDPSNFFNFYIVSANNIDSKLKHITIQGYKNFKIHNIVCDSNCFSDVRPGNNAGHVTIDSSLRFFIPVMLTQAERCIVLDCDLILNTDITRLYYQDIDGFFMGGGGSTSWCFSLHACQCSLP